MIVNKNGGVLRNVKGANHIRKGCKVEGSNPSLIAKNKIMKQTAIQWLVEKLAKESILLKLEDYFDALEMEKDQIKEAYEQGDIQLVSSDNYYKETYAE